MTAQGAAKRQLIFHVFQALLKLCMGHAAAQPCLLGNADKTYRSLCYHASPRVFP